MGIGKLESLDFHRENNWDVQHSVLILWLPERIQLEFPVYRDTLRITIGDDFCRIKINQSIKK